MQWQMYSGAVLISFSFQQQQHPIEMAKVRPEQAKIEEMLHTLEELRALLPVLTRHGARQTREHLQKLIQRTEAIIADLDPIKDPTGMFDPSVPETAGRLVALALLAQPRVALNQIAQTYGSGIYALYYEGDHPAYARISGTETPIYVGKADPKAPDAKTPREQGARLYGRLSDHRKAIRTVQDYALEVGFEHPLHLHHFSCRKLVCATNTQYTAERHLIDLFRPIWNAEIGICWGISKHGDAAETRANSRSPWDILHPGRQWALSTSLSNKFTPQEIIQRINQHLDTHPPFAHRDIIIEAFLAAFSQDPGLASPEEAQADDTSSD